MPDQPLRPPRPRRAPLAALAAIGAVGVALPAQAHVDTQRTQLQARVAAVRAALSRPPAVIGEGEPQQPRLVSQAANWTNWPKWSKWSNWANK